MHNFKSHFQWDFLAYCTRPVSLHLAMVCVGCSFDSFLNLFAQFKTATKSHENHVSCINFPIWPYPPQIMDFFFFVLVNCIGWQVCSTWQVFTHIYISKFNLNVTVLKPLFKNKKYICIKKSQTTRLFQQHVQFMRSGHLLQFCWHIYMYILYSCTDGWKGRKKCLYIMLLWCHLDAHQILLTICSCNYWYSFFFFLLWDRHPHPKFCI